MNDDAPSRLSAVVRSTFSMSRTLARRLLRAIAYGLAGGLLVLVVVFVLLLQNRPDLDVWHRVHLENEFAKDSRVETFADYLALEERLWAELETKVFAKIEAKDRTGINRYHRGSLADPARWEHDWNRSFELPAPGANVGVLLVHGMSDSPYSLRALAESLSSRGAWVVSLRLPGHGTVPAGLTDVRLEDMAAAVRIGLSHLRSRVDGPVFVVGYSTGGGLVVHDALRSLSDDSLQPVDGIVLISPAIGVSKVAVLASWQGRLGRLLRLDKLAWNEIHPEYDPFKYGSFAVNAGDVAWRLSGAIVDEIARNPGELTKLPPILAFQSAVDATVVTSAVVDGLFARLPDDGHEIVLFDVNRHSDVEAVLANDPGPFLDSLLTGDPRPFRVGVVSNRDDATTEVVLRVRQAGAHDAEVVDLGMQWPRDVFSLSHVALPKSYDDPLYGGNPDVESPGIQLGRLAFRGERGVLRVPPAAMLRLQWNPFYPWMEGRIIDFMGL